MSLLLSFTLLSMFKLLLKLLSLLLSLLLLLLLLKLLLLLLLLSLLLLKLLSEVAGLRKLRRVGKALGGCFSWLIEVFSHIIHLGFGSTCDKQVEWKVWPQTSTALTCFGPMTSPQLSQYPHSVKQLSKCKKNCHAVIDWSWMNFRPLVWM